MKKEVVLPDVRSRAPVAAGEVRPEGNRLDKWERVGKAARAEGERFDCAPWVHKARSMPREEFVREVEKELTGRESEPHEIIYFKIYRSRIPIIEQALKLRA